MATIQITIGTQLSITLRWRQNGVIASQITSLTIVYSTVYSDADQRKHQSSASLAFVRGIHRGPVNSRHKWPVTRKMFPFDDVIKREQEGFHHCQHSFLCNIRRQYGPLIRYSSSTRTICTHVWIYIYCHAIKKYNTVYLKVQYMQVCHHYPHHFNLLSLPVILYLACCFNILFHFHIGKTSVYG